MGRVQRQVLTASVKRMICPAVLLGVVLYTLGKRLRVPINGISLFPENILILQKPTVRRR